MIAREDFHEMFQPLTADQVKQKLQEKKDRKRKGEM